MGIKADKIKNVHVKQPNGQYSTIPLSGGGYATPQMYGAVGDGVTDDTEAFKKAFDSGQKIIIPQASYNLSQFIWTDDSVVLIDLGKYQSGTGKLIISKALTDGPVYEKMVTEFNPYWNPATNNTTNLFSDDVYATGEVATALVGTKVKRRLQGVCYIEEYDIFAFGFCQNDNAINRALLAFFRLTENNTFEYKGHGLIDYGGHLNSMCCRVEDKTTGKKAASDADSANKVVCIYSSCAASGGSNPPPTPSNGTAISVYGGGRIQIGRIPIIKNGDTYSIPTEDTFAQLVTAGDYGNYQDPEDDDDRYNRITYFCGVNSDIESQNRTLMRMTYDDDNDLFYVEYSKKRYDDQGNQITPNFYYFKPFSLIKNKWQEHEQNKETFLANGSTISIFTGVACIDEARDEAFKKLGIFSQLDKEEREASGGYVFDGQGPLVIDNQLTHVCYISKNVKHHGIYNNGIIIMQYNYATQGLKKVYRIPCPIATHQPQCLAHGKNGRIYLINDLGRSGTLGNKTIRITQLSFNEEVCSVPENPYFEPKKLDTYYAQYRGTTSDGVYAINLNYITEVGTYIFGGDNSLLDSADSNQAKVQAEYNGTNTSGGKRKILNGPGDDAHYFTLYVLPLVEYSRLQIYVTQHGEIYVRNLWVMDTGAKNRSGWRQVVETGRQSSSRRGMWYGAGYLVSPKVLRFTVPFPTCIYASARGDTPAIQFISLVLRQVNASKTIDVSTVNRTATTISTEGWGYNIEIHASANLNDGVSIQPGVVGIQANLRITF